MKATNNLLEEILICLKEIAHMYHENELQASQQEQLPSQLQALEWQYLKEKRKKRKKKKEKAGHGAASYELEASIE